jgi:hypothetical protein
VLLEEAEEKEQEKEEEEMNSLPAILFTATATVDDEASINCDIFSIERLF